MEAFEGIFLSNSIWKLLKEMKSLVILWNWRLSPWPFFTDRCGGTVFFTGKALCSHSIKYIFWLMHIVFLICKYSFTNIWFAVHSTHSSVNFTWVVLPNNQRFYARYLFKPFTFIFLTIIWNCINRKIFGRTKGFLQ